MRYLIIKRRKNFVACLSKMKVYIEDPAYGDTQINGCACSLLGTLKNGEEATFSIGNEEARVFLVCDRLTRNMFNDFRTLPAGDEDISLSCCAENAAFSANFFRFDGEASEAVQANRKRVKRNGILALVIGFIVVVAFGVGERFLEDAIENRPRDFSVDGMTITLTSAFDPYDQEGFAAAYGSDDSLCFVRKEDFSLAEGIEDLSLEEYGQILIQISPQAGDAQLQLDGGIPYFEYNHTSEDTGNDYNYVICLYKSEDAFWSVQFATMLKDAQRLRPDIEKWAASVRFE